LAFAEVAGTSIEVLIVKKTLACQNCFSKVIRRKTTTIGKLMNSLQILHLEDNPTEAELIDAILAEEGLDCQITVVDDGEGFTDMLAKKSFDLILADYSLPAFDGLTALEISKKNYPLIPFILVSGAVGEEIAIESLKGGATDYVMKTKLSRLAPAVTRAIEESKEHALRLELERQLQQTQKMEAIGTLAGGIAHDFNNILGAILGYGDMAMDGLPEESQRAKDIQQVLKAGHRAKGLVQQILAFSRQAEQELITLKIQYLAKEVIKLLRSTIPATIQITQDIHASCGPVLADPTQIHQIMINLCTNASHAMRENGGVLSIRLETVDIRQNTIDNDGLDVTPGDYVRLEVSDTGHGMSRSVMDRIFDPFFTTKGIGEDTGLGLAVVHGIVRSYNGFIKVTSELGKGTIFAIYLPQIDSEIQPDEALATLLPRGKENVLVVDDEKELVEMMARMLTNLGYTVYPFNNSLEAMEAFMAQPDKYDLVVTDMTMPTMTGAALAQKIISIRPDASIILCTGYSNIIDEAGARSMGISGYLAKPIIKMELAQLVRNVLDRKKG